MLSLDLDIPPSATKSPAPVYDLLANVTHESTAGTTRDKANTVWKVHLRAGGDGGVGDEERWFQVQDLIVENVQKEMIFLGETVLQVWERRDMRGRGKGGVKNAMVIDGI
jgi:U4/U6.U5 tri-snRNP-associated protein 2